MHLSSTAAYKRHDTVNQRLLTVLEGENLLFECGGRDETVDEYGALLTYAVSAGNSLVFSGTVPPRVQQEHIVGSRQVEADRFSTSVSSIWSCSR